MHTETIGIIVRYTYKRNMSVEVAKSGVCFCTVSMEIRNIPHVLNLVKQLARGCRLKVMFFSSLFLTIMCFIHNWGERSEAPRGRYIWDFPYMIYVYIIIDVRRTALILRGGALRVDLLHMLIVV